MFFIFKYKHACEAKKRQKNAKVSLFSKNQLCLHRHNSMNTKPNYFIQTQLESEPQFSGDIKDVYIHEGEVFLILKL